MLSEPESATVRALVGSELSSVVFVQDYLQFTFQRAVVGAPDPAVLRPPTTGVFGVLSAYTLPQIHDDSHHLRSGQPGYRDALVALIGRRVTIADLMGAGENEDCIRLEFESGVLLTISLDEEDLVAGQVESAMLQLEDDAKSWMVWRPANGAN